MTTTPSLPKPRPSEPSAADPISWTVRSKAPMRISFAGGGTDVSPYPETRGGAVLNGSIDKYAFATVRVRDDRQGQLSVRSVDYDMSARYSLTADYAYDGQLDLVKASIKVLRSYAADRLRAGRSIELTIHSDAPPGSGLGSSSTVCVALVGAFAHYYHQPWTPYEIAEIAYQIEREELGIRGGRQDQYAATFGGFNFMEFYGDRTVVAPLKIPRGVINELSYRLLLCYTGVTRYSGGIIERQQAGIRDPQSDSMAALDATKQLALDMKNELLRGNVDELGRLLDAGWQLKKRFAEGITNPQIDAFYAKAREAGAIGGKLLGAGGGGHLLLFCDFERRSEVIRAIRSMGGEPVDFAFEFDGLQTWNVRSPARAVSPSP
ncbi:MAG: GHMP kinase [Thermoplasmata archaeon]